MNNLELAKKVKDVATNYKTLYIMGCIGAPMTDSNKKRYCNNYAYNKQPARTKMIMAATPNTFGFDCVCLIKSILWGWNGDVNATYGGAKYASNNVQDISADQMIRICSDISADFSKMEIGEVVWMPGHIGVYIGDGLAVECTPIWKNGVQITACNVNKVGYNRRNWVKHGKLPYVQYVNSEPSKPDTTPSKPATTEPTINALVVDGVWGSKTTRRAQQVFGTTVDGIVSNQWACYKSKNPGLAEGFDWKTKPNGKGSQLIKAIQKWCGMSYKDADGEIGPNTITAMQKKLGTITDGYVSKPSNMVKAFQKYLNSK